MGKEKKKKKKRKKKNNIENLGETPTTSK